jgi:hypothetical protein
MILFDEDSDSRYYRVEAGTMTTADLDPLVDRLAGGHTGVFVIGVNAQRACFPSKVCESYLDGFDMAGGVTQPWMEGFSKDLWSYRRSANMKVLEKQGIDSSRYLIDKARAAGMQAWCTIRMNDQHCTYFQRHPIHTNYWMDHPELRVQSLAPEGGFDYAHACVRNHFADFVCEVIDYYDADGFVIDWLRQLIYFDEGQGEAHIHDINAMMERFRRHADVVGARRGKRIEIIGRVPTTIRMSRFHGFDGVEWAKRGWVDRLVLSPRYIRDYDIDPRPWKAAIGNQDFPVSVCIEHAYQPYPGFPPDKEQGVWLDEPYDERQIPFVRGACRAALARGSDGVYLFNFMAPRNKPGFECLFRECGDFNTLVGKECAFDITYDDADMREADFLNGWRAGTTDAFFAGWRAARRAAGNYPYQLPLPLLPGESGTLRFNTGPVPEKNPQVVVRLCGALPGTQVTCGGLQGSPCGDEEWSIPADALTTETATVSITNGSHSQYAIRRASLFLRPQ